VRDNATQRVASIWHIWGPIKESRHPQALYLSPTREVSFTPLRVGWHLAIQVFPPGITRERCLKPLGPDLIRGRVRGWGWGWWGGGISPYLILWRSACPVWLSPMNDDPGSTHILTRHYGPKSQTISQLMNEETAPTRQEPIVQSLRVIKTPADGVNAQAAPPSDNPDGTVGFIKSSVENIAIHMELTLRLSFQLRCSLEGYMVAPPWDSKSRPWRL
jgi:hypothetical protein